MTSSDISNSLFHLFGNHDYQLANTYIFGWESDYFSMTKSEYFYEVEIKISKSDFKADFKKTEKHHRLKNASKELIVIPGEDKEHYVTETKQYQDNCQRIYIVNNICPNKFYYACPNGLITKDEIPEYAGLIYCENSNHSCVIKEAKFLHKRKQDLTKILLDKFYFESKELKMQIARMRHNEKLRSLIINEPMENMKQFIQGQLF